MTDRRQVLQAGVLATVGVALLPGCSRDDASVENPPTPDPQQADELALIAAYDAAIANAGAAQTAILQQVRDDHAAHLRALGWQAAPSPSASATKPVSREALVRAERRAQRARTQAARDTTDADQATILALIAASEAQHVVILEGQ